MFESSGFTISLTSEIMSTLFYDIFSYRTVPITRFISLGHLLVIGINFPVVSTDTDITENSTTTGSTDYNPYVVSLFVLIGVLFIALVVSLIVVLAKIHRNKNRSKYAKKRAGEDSKLDQHQMEEQK